MKEILISVLPPFFAAAFSFVAGLRMAKVKVKKSELENVENAITIWREIAEGLNERIEVITKQNAEDYQRLFAQNVELLDQNKKLIGKITKLEHELELLKKTV